MIIGAHVSVQGGIENGPINANKLGISAIQVFSKNQRQWNGKPLSNEGVEKWFEGLETYGIKHKISHASYLVNLCNPDQEKREKSILSMVDELERAERLKLSNVVLHPGSHLKQGEEWGLKTIADSINKIHKQCSGFDTRITLENTAGQGSNLGFRFAHLGSILKQVSEPERLAICIDTCHAFSAGYDMRTEESYEEFWAEFSIEVGIEFLQVFHLNDSKNPLGSHIDRHEKIGKGQLGLEPFRRLLADSRFKDIPAILETPSTDGGYEVDIETLESLQPK